MICGDQSKSVKTERRFKSSTLSCKTSLENPSPDVYLVIRAGMVLPVEDHTKLIRDYLAAVEQEEQVMRDNCRVVVGGVFCEQPHEFDQSIEMAGCYIVDDDFMLITRWLLEDVQHL